MRVDIVVAGTIISVIHTKQWVITECQPDDDVIGEPEATKHHEGFVKAVVGNS
jgi:hypothetical protein